MPGASTSRAMRFIVWALTLALSAQCAQFAILYNGMLEEPRFSFEDYVDGEAHRPFAYRMLVPALLRGIDAVTPTGLDTRLDEASSAIMTRPADPRPITTGPENKYPRMILWLAAFDALCLFGYALIGSSLLRRLFPDTKLGLVAPLLFVVLVRVVLDQRFSHYYDFATLLLMASLVWALASERHLLFLAVFAVACLNKETAILASVGYAAVFFGRLPWPRYWAVLALQAAIFLAIYLFARLTHADNPGVGLEVWIPEQIAYLRQQPAGFFLVVTLNAFLVTFRWSEKPQIFHRLALMVGANAALFALGGYPGEYRAFFEVYLVLSLLVLRNAELIGRQWSMARAI